MTGARAFLVADSAGQQLFRAAPLPFPAAAGSHAVARSPCTAPGIPCRPIIFPVTSP